MNLLQLRNRSKSIERFPSSIWDAAFAAGKTLSNLPFPHVSLVINLHHVAMFHLTVDFDRWYHPTCAPFLDNYSIASSGSDQSLIAFLQSSFTTVHRWCMISLGFVDICPRESQMSRTSQPWQAGRLEHHCHVAAVSLLYRPQQCLAMLAMCIPCFQLLPCLMVQMYLLHSHPCFQEKQMSPAW